VSRKTLVMLAVGTLVLGMTGAAAFAAPGAETGPSSSTPPYLVRTQTGIVTKSILTTGDSVPLAGGSGNYRMVGVPDGLGAYDNGDGTFTMLSNHELTATEGTTRRHGAIGSFVSRWVINKSDLSVVSGQDQIQQVNVWDPTANSGAGGWVQATGAKNVLTRLCSADLPAISALYNPATGNGYNGRLFMDGEETSGGRPFAHVVDTGQSFELTPWLGSIAFENSVANPGTGDKTTVGETDDTSPGTSNSEPVAGQVYFYNGTKADSGNEVQKAGLTGGKLYGIKIGGGVPQNEAAKSDWAVGDEFAFSAVDVSQFAGAGGNSNDGTVNTLEEDSINKGVTGFQRPEDGSWDPQHPSDFYFVTTSNFGANSAGTLNGHTRLWRVRFNDPADPSQGGTIKLLVNGPVGTADSPSSSGTQSANSTGPQMFDNITVSNGQVVLLEDVGGQAYRGGVWVYDIATGSLSRIAIADPDVFTPGAPGFVTKDEEASGVIPAPFLGPGAFLLDEQVHKASSDAELVEGGQYMQLNIPPGKRF
jgi:hypothetical protein